MYIQWGRVFAWDRHNLRKIKAHRIDAFCRGDPVLIYEQEAESEIRYDAGQKRDYMDRRAPGE